MAKCADCSFFFGIPECDLDYEQGKGDCVIQQQDEKGKFWLSKPVFQDDEGCSKMEQKR